MVTDDIRDDLFELKDEKYRDFQGGLITTVGPEYFVGVRTPELRQLASLKSLR